MDIQVGGIGTAVVGARRDSSNSMRGTRVNISTRSSAGTREIGEVTVDGCAIAGVTGAGLGVDSGEGGRCGSGGECKRNLAFTRRTVCVRRRKDRRVDHPLSSMF